MLFAWHTVSAVLGVRWGGAGFFLLPPLHSPLIGVVSGVSLCSVQVHLLFPLVFFVSVLCLRYLLAGVFRVFTVGALLQVFFGCLRWARFFCYGFCGFTVGFAGVSCGFMVGFLGV